MKMSFDLEPDEQPFHAAMELHRRHISEEQMRTFKRDIAAIFTAFGLDLNTPATRETPQRFLRAMFDATEGYEGDPKLLTVFETECRGGPDCRLSQVIEGPIHFFSLCEHHALPFHGHAYVGYIAHEHIIGISKLTRLVRLFAKRFTVQERIGQQIADTLDAMLQPHGVAVYLEAHHLCTQMRGVREITPLTRTTFWRGAYDDNAALRTEFFDMCGVRK
jgi:GTP cyclohydrolase I